MPETVPRQAAPPLRMPPLSKGGRPARAWLGKPSRAASRPTAGYTFGCRAAGGKRRSEVQYDRALAAEPLRPILVEEPLKSDKAARHQAMEEWVEMWGGAPLMIEERRAQWWKQAKKQLLELVKAARARFEFGTQPSQSAQAGCRFERQPA